MKLNWNKHLFLWIVFAVFNLLGCKDKPKPGVVTLNFDHQVAGENLEFDELKYPSLAGHPFSVVRLKYYISNIQLHEQDGAVFTVNEVHYRDAREANTRALTISAIPAGRYDQLSFVFGLDEVLNVDGGLPNTTTNINMEWPIPGDQGYHYMKLEGKYDSLGTGRVKNFNLHTGATMGNQNYIEVRLPVSTFNVDENEWQIYLEMDINEWLQNPTTWDFAAFGPMIMMNQQAQAVLKANGATIFKIQQVKKE